MTHAQIALDLASAGVAVFPCHAFGEEAKRPMPGVFWRNQSTTDASRIEAWWRRWPDAAIGIDLAKSGLLVIDCDCKPEQPNGVLNFQELGHDLSDVPAVKTPSGGVHYYFRQTFDPPHGNGKGVLPPGIDVRGHGGYVIAPGCIMESGEYVSIHSCDPPEPPPWLVGLLRPLAPKPNTFVRVTEIAGPSPYGQAALQREYDRVCAAPKGTRNETINDAAFSLGQLAPHILSVSEITAAMENAARSWGINPKDKVFGKNGTIARAIAAGMDFPRGPGEDNHVRELVCVDGWFADAQTGEVLEEPSIPSGDLPDAVFENLPTLMADIVHWIVSSSTKPQPALALASAIAIIGTAAGRHLAGPTTSGTHLYIVALANTGYGKDRPLSAISRIMVAAGMGSHIGPDEFISMPAVINFLLRSPLSCCPMDEFGAFLKRINHRKASGFEASISKSLRTAWGKSFEPFPTPEWAGKPSTMIMGPALSIYGSSTPDEFYSSLSSADASNGFLNRFLVIEAKSKPEIRMPTAKSHEVPESIVDGVKAIYESSGLMNTAYLNSFDTLPEFETIGWRSSIALDHYTEFRERMEKEAEEHPERSQFLTRTHEMAIRLATIYAIAEDVKSPAVGVEAMEWGILIAESSARTMLAGVADKMAETDFQAQYKLVLGRIREAGMVSKSELYRHINGRLDKRTLDAVLSLLDEAGEIETCRLEPEKGSRGGRPKTLFRAIEWSRH